MIFIELFLVFCMIGAVSFGGGYAMIPLIEREVTSKGWLTTSEFTDIIAVAGMSPGPIATNSATVVGYSVAGIPGAIVSSLAMTLPSLVIILVIAILFMRFNEHELVKSAFYGLRPIITSLIIYAAINFSIANGVISPTFSLEMILLVFIFLGALFSLLFLKIHPALVIVLSGIIGVFVF
ncbi:chromate transporter [Evansella sp. AB-rgal1]|uniref:chromate transporter n=1 Tax=Evansella sp. AB-rgal1 TaxID=3242696 RepID=UPI00359CEA6D